MGSIEVGKLADLVVLDRDYLDIPDEEIKQIKSLLTLVGGRVVHASAPFDALKQ
jgi:predicted amidohydrolase YtcJ